MYINLSSKKDVYFFYDIYVIYKKDLKNVYIKMKTFLKEKTTIKTLWIAKTLYLRFVINGYNETITSFTNSSIFAKYENESNVQ